MNIKENILCILQNEVKPAIGCTEPVAIALCAAAASSQLKNKSIDYVKMSLSPNVYKNGMNVGIPNSKEIGLDVAASLGASKFDYSKGLEILGEIDDECREISQELLDSKKVDIKIAKTDKKVFIKCEIKSGADIAEAIIEDKHDNIVSIKLNGEAVFTKEISDTESNPTTVDNDFFKTPLSEIIATIEAMDYSETKEMLKGIEMNMKVAKLGLEKSLGIGMGYVLNKKMEKGELGRDFPNLAMILTAAASDARMSGLIVPVMSSSGSGNNGLTAILPLAAYKEMYEVSDEKLSKALAMSHIITSYVKHYIGRLSPLCGCSIAAATGSASAITWLEGGTQEQIQGTIKNILANQSGVLCDGAKPGCALKLGTAAAVGVQSVMLATEGNYPVDDNGIVMGSAEQCIANLKSLSEKGMSSVDGAIIDIMLGDC